jgi:hypothetical protein
MVQDRSTVRKGDSPMVDTNPGDRGAARLKRYWTIGPGAAKIRWGQPGDFNRCVLQLEKYVDDPQGLCNTYHVAVLGVPPGKE